MNGTEQSLASATRRMRSLLAIGLAVLLRLAVLIASPLEIGPDEAQYWRWSRTLDFGYYSKPPLIAWVIAASTAVFGEGEWAIRVSAPILMASPRSSSSCSAGAPSMRAPAPGRRRSTC